MKQDTFQQFVLEQLAGLRGLTCRAMFGGHGLSHGPGFFGIIHRGRLYFRTDAATRPLFLARGMKPFRPNRAQTLASYYEVPVDVLEDADQLLTWARQAVPASPDARKRGRRRRRSTR